MSPWISSNATKNGKTSPPYRVHKAFAQSAAFTTRRLRANGRAFALPASMSNGESFTGLLLTPCWCRSFASPLTTTGELKCVISALPRSAWMFHPASPFASFVSFKVLARSSWPNCVAFLRRLSPASRTVASILVWNGRRFLPWPYVAILPFWSFLAGSYRELRLHNSFVITPTYEPPGGLVVPAARDERWARVQRLLREEIWPEIDRLHLSRTSRREKERILGA